MQLTMMKDISLELGICADCEGFWSNARFLFVTDEEVEGLRAYAGKSRREIDKYVTDTRRQKLMDSRFESKEVFAKRYGADKIGTLERLFQEPINISKLSKLICDDPYQIYALHNSLPVTTWFMAFVIYL